MTRTSLFLTLICLTGPLYAANLAIIDSGVDYKHKDLASKMWTNANPKTTDADGAVYEDDTHGWNFPDSNNEIIDYKYLNTFPEDCTKVFVVQGKILKGTATQEEKDWYKSKKSDEEFLKKLGTFANFIHGTHVSGISSKDADKAHLIGMKLMPTEQPGSMFKQFIDEQLAKRSVLDDGNDLFGNDFLVKIYLSMAAQQQAKLLTTVGKYVAAVHSDVANGSFGTSVPAVKPVVKGLMKQLSGEDPSDADVESNAAYLVEQILENSKEFVTSAPDTLFVFAAGNDGLDNDKSPESPGNLNLENTITVAATLDVSSLATFSSYGANHVEVAAPGVVINSTIPGDKYLELSGTSMAAPFVTNVAGMVKDANPSLSPAKIKKILMDTADVKDFLKGKVKSSGIVNRERAVHAAVLSVNMPLAQAIHMSRLSVADLKPSLAGHAVGNVLVAPLRSLF